MSSGPVTDKGTATLAGGIESRVWAAAREIAPRADEHDRNATFPADGIAALWRAGLGNLTLSTERGGDGLSLLDTARAVRRIGAADASVALIWVMHLAHLILIEDPRFGVSDDARDTIIRSSLNGPALIIEPHQTIVVEVLALADSVGPTLCAADEARARAHFATTARYEWMFWDAAWRGEVWPV